jgi:hypothetical protein
VSSASALVLLPAVVAQFQPVFLWTGVAARPPHAAAEADLGLQPRV